MHIHIEEDRSNTSTGPRALQLSEYDYEVEHKKGKLNKVADALSLVEIAAMSSEQSDTISEERTQAQEDMRRDQEGLSAGSRVEILGDWKVPS